MNRGVVIRNETDGDTDAITAITLAALRTLAISQHTEQFIVKALIREGLARLPAIGARGCCLVGHPDYYRKFGFRNLDQLAHPGVPPEFFLALAFDGQWPQGTVAFHEAFGARE
ncbi:MAG: hypothetical protein NTV11_14870 [Rhodocyclales bacterium]|nr:hypothetical protein [Rhodocyclales bacterium]